MCSVAAIPKLKDTVLKMKSRKTAERERRSKRLKKAKRKGFFPAAKEEEEVSVQSLQEALVKTSLAVLLRPPSHKYLALHQRTHPMDGLTLSKEERDEFFIFKSFSSLPFSPSKRRNQKNKEKLAG